MSKLGSAACLERQTTFQNCSVTSSVGLGNPHGLWTVLQRTAALKKLALNK